MAAEIQFLLVVSFFCVCKNAESKVASEIGGIN